MLIAVAVGWDGRRSILGVELAHRESRSSWRDFLLGLKERSLHAVEFPRPAAAGRSFEDGAEAPPRLVADDHAGLRAVLREALAEAAH